MILGATITGSLILNSVNLASITGSEASINALNLFTASAATTGSTFLRFDDANACRLEVYSNGGIANYSANNVNLSDERTKKDIVPMESQWDIFKNIEFSKFKYKDQTHDDFNYGVIAQQVLNVAPHFVNTDGFADTDMLSVYDTDIHYSAHKALQECII